MYTNEDEKRLHAQAKALLTTPADGLEQMETLRDIINYADWKYYVQDERVFADEEYDKLFKRMKH